MSGTDGVFEPALPPRELFKGSAVGSSKAGAFSKPSEDKRDPLGISLLGGVIMKKRAVILSVAVAIACGSGLPVRGGDQPDQATQDQSNLTGLARQSAEALQEQGTDATGGGSLLWSGSAQYGPMWFDLLFSEANPPLSNVVEVFRQAQADPDNTVDFGLLGLSGADAPQRNNTIGFGMFGLSGTEMPSDGIDPFNSNEQNLPFQRATQAGANVQETPAVVEDPPTGISVSYSSTESTGSTGIQVDSSQSIDPFASGEGGVPEEGIDPFDRPADDGSTDIDQGINPFGSNSQDNPQGINPFAGDS